MKELLKEYSEALSWRVFWFTRGTWGDGKYEEASLREIKALRALVLHIKEIRK